MSEGSEQEDIGGCETCGELLTFLRATPKVGALPALETFWSRPVTRFGGPRDPSSGEDQEAPTSGGLPTATKNQTVEPPYLVDARSLRGSTPQSQLWLRIGDSHSGLLHGYADDHIQALGHFQKLLSRYHGGAR